MDPQDPKVTWVLKENLAQVVNKEFQELRVFLVHKAPLVPLVTRVLMESLVCLDYLDLMAPQVTLARKDLQVKRELWVPLVRKVLLVILDLVVSRVLMV